MRIIALPGFGCGVGRVFSLMPVSGVSRRRALWVGGRDWDDIWMEDVDRIEIRMKE